MNFAIISLGKLDFVFNLMLRFGLDFTTAQALCRVFTSGWGRAGLIVDLFRDV